MAETIPLIGLTVWVMAKGCILLALGLYVIFALVIIKQVYLMVETVEAGFGPYVKIIAWAHLIVVVGVLLTALTIL